VPKSPAPQGPTTTVSVQVNLDYITQKHELVVITATMKLPYGLCLYPISDIYVTVRRERKVSGYYRKYSQNFLFIVASSVVDLDPHGCAMCIDSAVLDPDLGA
jgi:hypothetical protein